MSISQDEDERARFRSKRMYQTDLQSNLATVEDRTRTEIAIKILQRGRPLQEIAEDTGLSIEEIKKFCAN